jgi:hypothetical protein
MEKNLLEINNLRTSFRIAGNLRYVVCYKAQSKRARGLNFKIAIDKKKKLCYNPLNSIGRG